MAIWYLLKGQWTRLEEVDHKLTAKLGTILAGMGKEAINKTGKTREALRQDCCQLLKAGRTYLLDSNKKFTPKAQPHSLTAEYGLR